ncbi:MAG: cupin domain-containing protein [Gammaproteobacteria bacterium]|nr:cupin domain-containing protein [Gammaproteobacteria bacterium]MDH3466133.1 cupin domain-containing protein [Gammaproteobacteria bacterium]
MIKESIKRYNPGKESYISEGCYITELLNAPDDHTISIARARVGPGVTTKWHRLRGISERYVILEGTAKAEVGELPPSEVNAGDIITIPSMCRQRVTNIGSGDLVFLAICTPRFIDSAYEDIGNMTD